jgi:hypothetical protein
MSLSFYMDENVHGAITTGLRLRGVDIVTVQEDGYSGIADALVLKRATELGRIVFSQDRDLLVEAKRSQSQGVAFPGVIYGHQLLVQIGDCVRDLELIAKLGEPQEFAIARVRHQLAISTGSACSSGVEAPSHVLRAMQLSEPGIAGALRLGLGKFNTEPEVVQAAALISEAVSEISRLLETG